MTNEWYNRRYPVNTRFGQYLVDTEQTPETYFGLEYDENDELIDETAGKFARAVYNRFLASEIGLEELDIFDIKMRGIWDANIELFKGLYDARAKYIESIATGAVESEITEYGHVVTDETDNVKKDVETTHGDSVVYADVSTDDGKRTREYKVTHSDSGSDTRTRSRAGDAANYAEIVRSGAADIFREFTEKFVNLFMGVL